MSARRIGGWLPAVGLVAFLFWFGNAQAMDRYWITLGIEALCVGTALVGLNILVGDLGLVSLGHYVFFIVGGFAGAIWAVQDWGLDPWLGFPAALVVGMTLGALLALTCCHLRGFYLTVVTLAFGLVSAAFALLFEGLFNGLQGRPVEEPLDTSFGFLDASNPNRPFVGLYWIGVVMLLLALYAVRNLRRSRWGRAYRAIREAELAAQACGVRSYWYKVSGFALSAGIVATAGVLAAQTNLQVTMLDGTSVVGRSFEWLIYLIVGGVGTIAGPVVGAFTFTLGFGVEIGGSTMSDRLGSWQTLFEAALVIAVVLAAPEGIVGAFHRAARRWHAGSASPGDSRPRRRCRPSWPSRVHSIRPARARSTATSCSASRASPSVSAASRPCARSTSRCAPGRCTGSSDRTGRASRPW